MFSIGSLELVNKCTLMTTLKYIKKSKKTWDLLKETTFGTKTSRDITKITSNGKSTNNPTEMANIFNKFFAEIGEKISDSVQQPEKQAGGAC